jgi:uncharacterized protein YgbK (DUF1537 family)
MNMMELKGFKVNEDLAELINQAKAIAKSQAVTQEDLARLEKVTELLMVGSSKLNEAMSSNSNGGKRKELLEQAFKAYVEIVPYLSKMPYLTVPVLQQIKNIEKLMEMEIEKSVNTGASINIDEVMKVARESFL